jgi:CubicO group peptidase (beta-lactamase class C family)
MSATRLPGLSLAIIQDGRIVHERGYGMRDWRRGIPATPATLYGIGSVTKSFTCLAIMQLQERGLLSVDDPVDKYLDFPIKPCGEQVRIHHFMSHTSGIPALAFAEAVLRQPLRAHGSLLTLGGPEDMLLFMDQAGEWAHARPGERWFYLNEGYVLLGAIIAKVSGMPYADYVREHILAPLGMSRSFFARHEVESDPDAAIPSYFDPQGTYHAADYCYGKITSEGGLISSVQEMAKYAQMYISGGLAADGSRVLGADSVKAMFQPRIATPPEYYAPLSGEPAAGAAGKSPTWYGYGLRVTPMGEHRVIGHGGSVFVATAEMAFIPERQTGAIVLTNASGYPCSQYAMYALATALGEDPEQLPFVQVERRLEALEGRYETYKGTTTVVVKRRGSFLAVENQDTVSPSTTLLIPERLGDDGGEFWTISGTYRLPAEFIRCGDRVELLMERYKYRRVGK